jgi:hypothetical protein
MRPLRFALARLAVKRSGSAVARAMAKRWAKSLTSGHSASRRQRYDDVEALAAGRHREALQAHVGEVAVEIARRSLHLVEAEAFVGVDVEDQPVGLLDRFHLRAPAVELDRPHLGAGDDPGRIRDIDVILDLALLLLDRDLVDVGAEAAGIMLLEEAFARPALGAADEAQRPVRRPIPSSRDRWPGNNRPARPW